MFIKAVIFAACCLVAATSLAAAGQDLAADTALVLDNVTVTANRHAEIIPSERLDGTRLKSLSALSVADAIRHFSGVQIKDFGGVGGIKTINIRSMGSHHTSVYMDGIQLGNAQNGQIDLGRYDLADIGEITLYNGNKSNIFQGARDYGSAGAIYLRSRRPHWAAGERYHIRAGLAGGSFGLVKPDFAIDCRLSPSLSLSASAGYTYATGRYKFRYRRLNRDGSVAYDTTAVRHNSDIEALRAQVALNGYNTRGTWMAKAYFYNSHRGIPGAIVNNVFRNGERQWDRNFMVNARTEQAFSHCYNLMTAVKYANDWMHYLRNDPRELYVDNRYRQQEAYLSTAHLFTVSPTLKINLAADIQYNTLAADMALFVHPRRWTFMEALALDLSLPRVKSQVSALVTTAADRTRGNTGIQSTCTTRSLVTPAAFVNIDAGHGWHITAFAKESWRLPTFNDLYYTEIGNKDLKPERTWQFSLGTNRTFRTGILSLTTRAQAYHNRVSDKIIAYPAGQQFRWTMLNLGFVSIFGAEIGADVTVVTGQWNINTHLGYTWQSARDRTDPADSYFNHQIPYIPRHSFSASAAVIYKAWQLNYSTIYTGKRWSAQENIPANMEQPWYTHDLALFRTLAWKGIRWRIGLEINNLFGQDYEVIKNYPMPGRSFRGIINMEI